MKYSRCIAPLLMSTMLFSMGAQAEGKAYKCIIDGRTVFQQSACPAYAEPEVAKPVDGSPKIAVSMPAKAASAAKGEAASAAASASAKR